MYGYHGKYLWIDAASGRSEARPLAETELRRYLGGVGLGVRLLARESAAGVDPLSPPAALVIVFSPLVGTPLTTSAKFAVVAKSPLTGRLNDALASSHFALAGKRAGVDALVIVGRCRRPSVLVVRDGKATLQPANELWGHSGAAAESALRQQLGPEFHCLAIGPAGERQVRYATLSHGNRHAGRGGLGAILGSKNIKAVAVAGTQRARLFDPAGLAAFARQLSERSVGPATAKYRELGTLANLLVFNRLAALPTRNFQENTFSLAADLSAEMLAENRRHVRESCAACTIGCEHIYASPAGDVRLEYETLFALGPLCGVGNADAVLSAARRCDELGLDTISTGATIAFAMECAERGWLSAPGLRFGAADAMLEMIELIGCRDGLGDWLAEGSRRLAERLGGDAERFAPHVKGLEIPGYEPRALQTMALGFAVGSRGADHNRSGAYEADFSGAADRLHGTPDAARLAVETEDRAALMDSLILCKFLRGVFSDLFTEAAEMLRLTTGWDATADELRQTARRIVTAKKLYNLREGWTRQEDTLPERFLTEPLASGVASGTTLTRDRLDAMIRAYYSERGWDADGRPTPELCATLELKEDAALLFQ